MIKKEKNYTLIIPESEFKNFEMKRALEKIVDIRLKINKSKDFYQISEVEYEFLKRGIHWVPLEKYKKSKGFKKHKGEIGKYKGKRVTLVK